MTNYSTTRLNHHSKKLIRAVKLDDGREFLSVKVSIPDADENIHGDHHGEISLNKKYAVPHAKSDRHMDLSLGSPDMVRKVRIKKNGQYVDAFYTNRQIGEFNDQYYISKHNTKHNKKKGGQ